ncbi:MAG: peptidylprolyl isomerase [Thermoanaerobaculia bacterium]
MSGELRRTLPVLLVTALASAGCARETRLPPPHAVAQLGERTLKYSQFERYLERNVGSSGGSDERANAPGTSESFGALTSAALSQLFDQFLEAELLVTLARERGLATPGSDADEAIGALLASINLRPPGELEIAKAFEEEREQLTRPERVLLRQILVEDRPLAERARRELIAGAEFSDVVARLTPEGSAPIGAEQGELARDDLPPAFADLVFRLADGGVSPVVTAEYGFHVFQVVRHLPAHTPDLAEARAEIEDRLRREAGDAALAELSAAARSRYTVEVYERNLPFSYRGSFPISRPPHVP